MISNTDLTLKNRLGLDNFNFMIPATYFPTPNKNNYDDGSFVRYFINKRNQNQIIETNARDYSATNDWFFIKGELTWQLTGVRNNQYNGNMLVEPGVEEYNIIQINNLRKTMSGIENILTNPLQFWQGY
jgi:hypothetical protein